MTFTSHKSQISAPRVTNTLNKRGFAEKHIFQQTSFLFLSTQAGLLHFEAMLMWFPSGFVGCTTDLNKEYLRETSFFVRDHIKRKRKNKRVYLDLP